MNPRCCEARFPGAETRRVSAFLAVLLGVFLVRLSVAAPPCLSGPPVVVAGETGTVILWQTGTELDVLGFHLYRLDSKGVESRLNPRLLPGAVADGVGAAYRHRDALPAARYELGIVDTHGREYRMSCVRPALPKASPPPTPQPQGPNRWRASGSFAHSRL